MEYKMSLSEHQIKMLEIVARVAPNAIMRKYKDTCCIAAARVVTEVLKKLHFKDVRPFVVEANIFNEVYVRKGRTPQSDEEAQQWLTEGAWQVVMGDRKEPSNPGQWAGHLAVLLHEEYLLDIAIFQASRPQKQINLHPIFTSVPPDFVKGEDKCGLMFNNCMVVYVPYPNDKSYEAAKDWWDVAKSKDVVSEIVSEVKRNLAKKK